MVAKFIKVTQLDYHNCSLVLDILVRLLALLDLRPYNCRHQDIDNALELLILLVLAILCDKVDLSADFIPVGVVHPQKDVGNNTECHPR